MITRTMLSLLRKRLTQFPIVAVLGPRQVGKTTLARQIAAEHTGSVYLDLERPSDRSKLADPELYLQGHPDVLVVLDEVQRLPSIYEVLRSIIDDRRAAGRRSGQFLLLGSASIDLLQKTGETLAGRVAYIELHPFSMLEVDAGSDQLWVRGGFPDSFLAADDGSSMAWRENFIRTYLERDIPQLGPRVPAETLRRFWTMLAHAQSGLFNASELGRGLAIDGRTVARYLDLLVDLLLVRRIPPHHGNVGKRLVKSPKVYVRDSGIVHALLRLETREQLLGHPIVGGSWEGFVIENLLSAAPEAAQPSFYRTLAGAEIDLLLELPGGETWAIEIKRGLSPKLQRGFHHACEDLQPHRAFVVYSGQERYPKSDAIEVIGLQELCTLLSQRH